MADEIGNRSAGRECSITAAPSICEQGHFPNVSIARKMQIMAHLAGREVCQWPLRSALDEGEQVGVDDLGVGRGHAVRKALVGFERAVLQELN